ncbi:MAG: hypothetical protein ACJAVZ_003955 [Afipia broomeae]|jgi:hypothetical protein
MKTERIVAVAMGIALLIYLSCKLITALQRKFVKSDKLSSIPLANVRAMG